MKKKFCILGICTALVLSGCSLSSNDASDSTREGSESTVGEATANADAAADADATEEPNMTSVADELEEKAHWLDLGDKGSVGDWKFKPTKVKTMKKIKNGLFVFKPGKGQQFVVVSLAATNKGKKAASFLPRIGYSNTMISAKLYYEDYEYKPTSLMSYDKDLLDKSIKPLTTQKGIITFEVPKKIAKKTKKMTLCIGTDDENVTYQLK